MKEKMFSVITVVLNDKYNFLETVNSVLDQKKNLVNEIEYVVIDGASTDGTKNIANGFKKDIDIFVSEPDKGLYDAMNKGIALSSGEYLIFMNAGDKFCEKDTLTKIKETIIKKNYPDFIYGDALEKDKDGNLFLKKAYSHNFIWYGMFTHHQSMCYKARIIRNHGIRYKTKYKIAADYAFTYEFLSYAKTIVQIDFPVCTFLQGGISSRYLKDGLLEANLIRKKNGELTDLQVFFISCLHKLKHFIRMKFGWLYNFIRFKRIV